MNQKQVGPQPSITLGDIYYVLFRRKWLILSISLLGLAAAVATYLFFPFPYQSEAKLFIRYVLDTSSEISPDTQLRSPDGRGANILNSELELLTSRDVAVKAAEWSGRNGSWANEAV